MQELTEAVVISVSETATRTKPARRKPLGLIRRFSRARNGSVSIEFAIMATPFLALMFAIVESGIGIGTQQLISSAVDQVAREVRTGRIDKTGLTGKQLHDKICAKISLMAPEGCPDLIVDLNNYQSFVHVPRKLPIASNGDIRLKGLKVNPGGPGTINHMRVFYKLPVMTDFLRKSMSNLPGGKTLLYYSATWRNEAYE
jgi:Flp pilus assembly protein TadG